MQHRFLLTLAALVTPALAWAHPGHGDHDFGWDFVSSAQHLLLDHYQWLLGAVVVAALVVYVRREKKRD